MRGQIDHLTGNQTASDEFDRRQFQRLTCQAFAVGERDRDTLGAFGKKVVAAFRQDHAKVSCGIGRGERLLPTFVLEPLACDESIGGRFAGHGIGDAPRDHAAVWQRDGDVGREFGGAARSCRVVAMEDLEGCL